MKDADFAVFYRIQRFHALNRISLPHKIAGDPTVTNSAETDEDMRNRANAALYALNLAKRGNVGTAKNNLEYISKCIKAESLTGVWKIWFVDALEQILEGKNANQALLLTGKTSNKGLDPFELDERDRYIYKYMQNYKRLPENKKRYKNAAISDLLETLNGTSADKKKHINKLYHLCFGVEIAVSKEEKLRLRYLLLKVKTKSVIEKSYNKIADDILDRSDRETEILKNIQYSNLDLPLFRKRKKKKPI